MKRKKNKKSRWLAAGQYPGFYSFCFVQVQLSQCEGRLQFPWFHGVLNQVKTDAAIETLEGGASACGKSPNTGKKE